MKKIYFDLDGTIYDLYGRKNWLVELRNEVSPFYDLQPLVDLDTLNLLMDKLILQGNSFGVITWLPMDATREFEDLCRKDKAKRLIEDFGYNQFETHSAVKYGTPKHSCVLEKLTPDHVLIDDNLEILADWTLAGGTGIEARRIMYYLTSLLK